MSGGVSLRDLPRDVRRVSSGDLPREVRRDRGLPNFNSFSFVGSVVIRLLPSPLSASLRVSLSSSSYPSEVSCVAKWGSPFRSRMTVCESPRESKMQKNLLLHPKRLALCSCSPIYGVTLEALEERWLPSVPWRKLPSPWARSVSFFSWCR